MSPTSHTTLDAYLAALPAGIRSYPASEAKAAVLLPLLDDPARPLGRDGVPSELVTYLDHPPAVSSWIPEVHLNAALLALYDQHFAKHGGIDAYEHWTHSRNLRLLRSSLYRILFAVVSPERVVNGAAKRWEAFRRGSTITVIERSDHHATLAYHHPRNMVNGILATGFTGALRAAMELAGARDVRMKFELESPSVTSFRADWR